MAWRMGLQSWAAAMYDTMFRVPEFFEAKEARMVRIAESGSGGQREQTMVSAFRCVQNGKRQRSICSHRCTKIWSVTLTRERELDSVVACC